MKAYRLGSKLTRRTLAHENRVVYRNHSRLLFEFLTYNLRQPKETHMDHTIEELQRLANTCFHEFVRSGDAALPNGCHSSFTVSVLDIRGHIESPYASKRRNVHRVWYDRVKVGLERAIDGREAFVPIVNSPWT
ncbi:hypothetical protein PsorP6_015208 [Peronosclerospora sorghi]|uniref:Uncharacterized protein n=1 Tax=Peronosclerospora sorghi TaxID=230839 RepID=A0ACC0VSD6_9STRA|nr:hypothetical protein PsorP6_015208 [Peronosclerospora sorghi]